MPWRLLERDLRPHRPCALVLRDELDRPARGRAHQPFHLRAILGRVAAPARPAARYGGFVRAAFELRQLLSRAARLEPRSRRQLDLGDDAPYALARERPLGDVAREPARVLHDEPDPPGVGAEAGGARLDELEPGRDEEAPHEPLREARKLLLEHRMRRVRPGVERVPTAELDLPELRVPERIPVDETAAAERSIVPREELEVILHGVFAVPLDELVLRDPRRALRAPDLDRPGEHPEMVVGPVVERAGDDFLRVI